MEVEKAEMVTSDGLATIGGDSLVVTMAGNASVSLGDLVERMVCLPS
jgi:hypothetical protein